MAVATTAALLLFGSHAQAATTGGPILLVQGTDQENVIPFGTQSASLVIGKDRSMTIIIGEAPDTSLVYVGTITEKESNSLLNAIAAAKIGIQPDCTGALPGVLSADNGGVKWRFTRFGVRRVHTFTASQDRQQTCSPAVLDLIVELSRIVFAFERDPKTVVIH